MGPQQKKAKKRTFIENYSVESQGSSIFSASKRKVPSKVMSLGTRRFEGFLISSNFDVFKNRNSTLKQKTIKKLL